MNKCYAVVIAGGRGERFWPVGRSDLPKQFLTLAGDEPMIVETVGRLRKIFAPEQILVVTSLLHTKGTRELLPDLPACNIIGEPASCDTAPALTLATALVQARGGQSASMMAFPADQLIGDADAFEEVLRRIIERLKAGAESLFTIGIKPTFAAENYGYIEAGEMDFDNFNIVRSFREKPDKATAEKFLLAGNYYWNGGIFGWNCDTFSKQLEMASPELAGLFDRVFLAEKAGKLDAELPGLYAGCRRISIDYALMEKAANVRMIEGDFGWDDVGGFGSIAKYFPHDKNNNAIKAEFCGENVTNSVIIGDGNRIIAGIDLSNMMIVQSGNATLICPIASAGKIKELLQKLTPEQKKFL